MRDGLVLANIFTATGCATFLEYAEHLFKVILNGHRVWALGGTNMLTTA